MITAATTTTATLVRGAITVSLDARAGLVRMTCREHGTTRSVRVSHPTYSTTVAAFLDTHDDCGGSASGYVSIDSLSAWGG